MDDNTNKEEGIGECDHALCLILLLMDKTNKIKKEIEESKETEKVHEREDILSIYVLYIVYSILSIEMMSVTLCYPHIYIII